MGLFSRKAKVPPVPDHFGIPGARDFRPVLDDGSFIGWTFAWDERFSWMEPTGSYMSDDIRPDPDFAPDPSCGTSSSREEAERKLRAYLAT